MSKKSQSIIISFIGCMLISSIIFVFTYDTINDYRYEIELLDKKIEIQKSFFNLYSKILKLTYSDNSKDIIYEKFNFFIIETFEDKFIIKYEYDNTMYETYFENVINFCQNYNLSSTQKYLYEYNGNCVNVSFV